MEYPIPVANDACDGPRPVTAVPAPGSFFPIGRTEVVASAEDGSGNRIECTFIVDVQDTSLPEITCPEPIVTNAASSEGARVEFAVTAVDACEGDVAATAEPPSGSLFPLGQTTVTCRAVDGSGNARESAFTVTVVDRTPPEIVCPDGGITVFGSTSGNPQIPHSSLRWPPEKGPPVYAITAVVDYPGIIATDPEGGSPQVTCTPPSGSRFAMGTHTVTAKARDAAGNETTCDFRVTVIGIQAFIRGDSNLDARIDIADPVALLCHLFLGNFDLRCEDAADANDSGTLDIADPVRLLSHIFQGGPPPPEPYPSLCGIDPTPDALDCLHYYPCE